MGLQLRIARLCTRMLVVFMIAALLAGCQTNLTGKVTQQEEQTIKIGALLSLTGDAALYGRSTLEGVEEAIRQQNEKGGINGKKLELVIETYNTLDTKKGISALHKLVDIHGVQYIIGPTWDDPAISIAANELGVIMIATDNSDSAEKELDLPHTYSVEFPYSNMMETLAQYSIKKGKTKIAIIYDQNSWSENIAEEFAKQKGLTVVYKTQVAIDSKDFNTEILKIKQVNPDAIFVAFADELPKIPFFKQLRTQGVQLPVYGAPSTENHILLDNAADALEQIAIYPFPKTNPLGTTLIEAYSARTGKEPSLPYITNGFDATNMFIKGFERGVANPEEMKEYLDTNTFETITYGPIQFNEKGYVESNTALYNIKTVENGAFVIVE